jgi:hypothetical protein
MVHTLPKGSATRPSREPKNMSVNNDLGSGQHRTIKQCIRVLNVNLRDESVCRPTVH